MNRVLLAVLVAVLGAGTVYAGAVVAQDAPSGARHSDNMRLVANYSDEGAYRNGTDMAFQGNLAVLGNLDQGTGPNASPPGGFRLMDLSDPAQPAEVGQFVCSGDQTDVSIWHNIVITSIDKPTLSLCDEGEANWEGLRIVSIADRSDPEIVSTVRTDCGSHTHTIYPDLENARLLVYVLSYPLAGRYNPAGALPTCNPASHRKISVVEVPLGRPQDAQVIGTPSSRRTSAVTTSRSSSSGSLRRRPASPSRRSGTCPIPSVPTSWPPSAIRRSTSTTPPPSRTTAPSL